MEKALKTMVGALGKSCFCRSKVNREKNDTFGEETIVKGKERVRRWEVTILQKQKGAKIKHLVIL